MGILDRFLKNYKLSQKSKGASLLENRSLIQVQAPSQQKTSPGRQEQASTKRSDYYVYAHIDPQGNTFYIGKGVKNRAWTKERNNPYWQHYVKKHNGIYHVEILKDGLDENEAYELEADLIRRNSESLVNWGNRQPGDAYKGMEQYWSMRKENDQLVARAMRAEETDKEEAATLYKQALEKMYIYEEITGLNGLVSSLNREMKAGNINILNRLTICLKKLGRSDELLYEVERYLQIFPASIDRSAMKPILKRAGYHNLDAGG